MLFRQKEPKKALSVRPEDLYVSGDGRVSYPKLFRGAVLSLFDDSDRFIGKAVLRAFSISELDLIRCEGEISLPSLQPGDVIHVQGCGEGSESFTLSTHVFQASRLNIRLRDLALVVDRNSREAPRFFVGRPAEISNQSLLNYKGPVKFKPEPDICYLVDISMTGARVQSDRQYSDNEIVRLRVELYPNAGKISFMLQVIRAVDLEDGKFEYGMLFEELPRAKRLYLAEDLRHLSGV